MSRPSLTDIASGTEAWDATINDNHTVLKGPLPIKVITGIANLPAAGSNDQCIVIVNESGTFLQFVSDGTLWRSVGGELPYGLIYVDAGSSGQTLSAATDTKIDQFTADGIGRNVTLSNANDKLTIPAIFKGRYQVGFQISGTGLVSRSYEVSMRVGGVRDASLVAEAVTGDVAAEVSLSATGFIDVSASKDLELYIIETTGGLFTVTHGQLWARCLEVQK